MRASPLVLCTVLAAVALGGCVVAPPLRCAWVPGHWRWTDAG